MAALVVLLIAWALLSIAAALGWLRVEDRRRAPLRMALGVMFVFTGITHFTGMAQDYLAMIPAPLPRSLGLIYLTGLLEIAGGVGLQVPRLRRAAAIGLILLLLAMFPANVNAALNDIPFRGEPPTPLAVRLPMQLFFLAALGWSAGPWRRQLPTG